MERTKNPRWLVWAPLWIVLLCHGVGMPALCKRNVVVDLSTQRSIALASDLRQDPAGDEPLEVALFLVLAAVAFNTYSFISRY